MWCKNSNYNVVAMWMQKDVLAQGVRRCHLWRRLRGVSAACVEVYTVKIFPKDLIFRTFKQCSGKSERSPYCSVVPNAQEPSALYV